ncbi:transposable element Tcb1 transposase [Trichonephila clavipes]|nr:transposable element Tcb1 transposase [Trichonephila clavipes]
MDNKRPQVAGIEWTFLDMKKVRLLPWPAFSTDISTIENVWSMVDERLSRQHTSVTTVDELWHRVEAAWASVYGHALQSLFDSTHRRCYYCQRQLLWVLTSPNPCTQIS